MERARLRGELSVQRAVGLVIVFVAIVGAGALLYRATGGGAAGPLEREAVTPPAERVRVEVLNAGGVGGVARDATLHLRDAGFDVVHFGNARAFDREGSVVIDRVGRPDLAEAVAKALGIGNVLTEPDPNLFVDVSVLLGRTWQGSGPPTSGAPPERAPWDPRGWLGR